MPKVKTCPFCKSNEWAYWAPMRDGYVPSFTVICLRCGAKGPTAWSKEDAIMVWNKRVR